MIRPCSVTEQEETKPNRSGLCLPGGEGGRGSPQPERETPRQGDWGQAGPLVQAEKDVFSHDQEVSTMTRNSVTLLGLFSLGALVGLVAALLLLASALTLQQQRAGKSPIRNQSVPPPSIPASPTSNEPVLG